MISPVGLTLQDWADSITFELETSGAVPRLDDAENWREWGTSLIRLSLPNRQDAPTPDGFDDWFAWAERFVGFLGANS